MVFHTNRRMSIVKKMRLILKCAVWLWLCSCWTMCMWLCKMLSSECTTEGQKMKTCPLVGQNHKFLLSNNAEFQVTVKKHGGGCLTEACISMHEFVFCRVELDPSPDPVCFTCISMKYKVIYPSTAISLSLKPVKQTLISFPGKVTCHIVQLLQSLVPRFYLYLGKALTPHTAPMSQPSAGGGGGGLSCPEREPLFDLAGLRAQTCLPLSVKSTSHVQLRLCPLKV